MVANGIHVLASLAVIYSFWRARRPEPYLTAAVAAAIPDVDVFLFHVLGANLGAVQPTIWTHRGVTHSLFAGLLVVGILSRVGPWDAAAVGVGSHLVLAFLTGGIQLLAPVDSSRYGLMLDWMAMNLVTASLSVTVLLIGLLTTNAEWDVHAIPIRVPELVTNRFR